MFFEGRLSMETADYPTRQLHIRDGIDRLLRSLPEGYTDALYTYVIAEKEKLEPDNRMKDMSSHIPGGDQTVVAMFVARERFRTKVRWGDFISAIYEDVVLGNRRSFPPQPQQAAND
jgi:hypothetical protein